MHVLKKKLCPLVSYTYALRVQKLTLTSLEGFMAEWFDGSPNSKILLFLFVIDSCKTALDILNVVFYLLFLQELEFEILFLESITQSNFK